MAKVYTPKRYELKEIGNLLKDKSDQEKAVIKAQELGKVKLSKFTLRGQDSQDYEIEIIAQPTEERGMLKVSVRAFRNGQELFIDNPLYFKNPPIMVSDGTFHKAIDDFGNEIDQPNFVEDPEESLKRMIVDTVRITGK